MVRLKENKSRTENKAIVVMPVPRKVFIPLCQHLGKICSPEVKPGDQVVTGQRIGAPAAAMPAAAVHSSVTGKVVAVEEYAHPVLSRCSAVAVETVENEVFAFTRRSQAEVSACGPEALREIIRDAGIVGMGGAGFPSFMKLNPPLKVETLIINAAECEPYLTGDYRLMLENSEEILKGAQLLASILGVGDVCIAIEDNKPEAIEKFNALSGGRARVKVLKSFYPQGGEKQLIKSVLGREVPRGKLPFETKAVVHNLATVFAVYQSVYLGKPLYERVVTVSGGCVANPGNFLVRVGTLLSDLISFCGPLLEEPVKIITGGPMMGIAQADTAVPVTKTTTGVLLLGRKESRLFRENECIRCGRCVRVCSSGLMPCLLSAAAEKGMLEEAKKYGLSDCVECGACAYACPANRNLVQCIKKAKAEVSR